jgi:hypothetical protein
MALAQLTTSGFGVTVDPGVPLVQLAQTWGDWFNAPYIQPLQASLVAAPSIGQATFLWRYGYIQHEDMNYPVWEPPHAWAGYFVRVILYLEGTQTVLWMGIIQEQEYKPFGSDTGNPAGDQLITAYTLDWCLDRIAIIGAWTTDGYINTCPQFNLRREWIPHPVGNKSAYLDNDGLPQFGPDKQQWTALDVLTYLMAHYAAPSGLNIFIGGQTDALTNWHYVWPLEGLTLRQAFDKLIDRRRGLGWWLFSDGATIELQIYTTLETDITFPAQITDDAIIGGATIPGLNIPAITIPGNNNQITYAWDDALLVDNPIIATTESNRYDSIIVQGARMMSTFTIGTADGTLTPMWTAEDEALYIGIRQENTNYTMTSDMVRGQDRWKHIYQLFGIRSDWNWMINGYPVAPQFDSNAYLLQNNLSGATYNDINRPLQRVTRLPRPYTAKGPFAGNIQYMEPQVFATPAPANAVYSLPPNTTLPSGQSVIRGDLAGYVGGNVPPFSVTMADIAPAIEINAGLPHIMGAADYPAGTDTQQTPWYDWRTLLATLCIETDVRPTVQIDLQPDSPWLRTLHIEVPHAEFWWLTPGTIVYQNPDLSLNIAGGYATRDDTQILRNVAALAQAWYGVRRTPVSWSEKYYLTGLNPGQLITSVSASNGAWVDINTVITAITWDFQAITTHVMTGYGELDAAIVLDIPGMSDFASVGRAFNRLTADMQQTKSQVGSIPNRVPPVTNGGGSLVLAQVTANNSDGTINVDLYANGTFDALGSQLASTGIQAAVIPEYFSAMPSVGAWLAITKANGNWYTINAPAPPVGTGISSDFFVELFDRADSGVLNGNWFGALVAYDVVGGTLQSVLSAGLVTTATSLNINNYIANLTLTCQAPPAPDANGYINTGAPNTYTFKFGEGGSFGVSLSLWTANSAASLATIANAETVRSNAITSALNIKTTTNASDSTIAIAARASAYDTFYNQLYIGELALTGNSQSATLAAIDYANALASSYSATAVSDGQSIWPNIGVWAIACEDAYAAANASLAASNTASLVAYNNAIAAAAAYSAAIANLQQSTYCNLSITKNSAVVSTLTNSEVSTPQTTNFNLNIAVNAGTITTIIGDTTLSYSDTSVLRNCATFSITAMAATSPAQIDSIKIYRGDMPVPPNQSGYGKYVPTADVPVQYRDSYHTPVMTGGVLAGYAYNPNA